MNFGFAQLGAFSSKHVQRIVPSCIMVMLLIAFLSTGSSFAIRNIDLAYHAASSSGKFPRKIWQTWKVDPFGFEQKDLDVARTWTQKNPSFRYEVLTDQNDMYYVETHYGPHGLNRPDIIFMYKSITAKIVKADFLRYLIMYAEGGVYADIDVEALRPVERFIPSRYEEKNVDMIIGIEIDQPEFKNHSILGQKSQSFCQWTFACKPRLPVMLKLVENIMLWLTEVAQKQNKPISGIVLDFDEIITGTGPSAFTRAVLAEMSRKNREAVEWDTFHAMSESKLVGGVLVLTVEAFAAGQGHSDSGNHNAKQALVKHHYHASKWPTAHPRFKHPVYGEVEKCNWNPDCVRQWDENMAAFAALSPEDQKAQIALHEIQNAQLDNPPLIPGPEAIINPPPLNAFPPPAENAFGSTPDKPLLPADPNNLPAIPEQKILPAADPLPAVPAPAPVLPAADVPKAAEKPAAVPAIQLPGP
jgi:mannosyltransferase OCH1-like enzyme